MAMKPSRHVGIVGYGSYVPRYRLTAEEISRLWRAGHDMGVLPVHEKSVPGPDEDSVTMSIEAARNALRRARIDAAELRAVWVGSESPPYAVKPSSTIVAQSIGAVPNTNAGDLEFACKAGSEAMQAAIAMVGSGMARYAMAIGMDTAQGRPGDALEYTAAAGGAAYVFGPGEESLAVLEASYSFVTDTPDFFRRAHQHYPEHASRFTGKPAYFHHVVSAGQHLMDSLGLTARDYTMAVFHQPNVKFPKRAALMLGFATEQIRAGMLVPEIGNTYAGSSLIGLSACLDVARPGDRILMVSFGSGAGSDAFSFVVSEKIAERQPLARPTKDYVARRRPVHYATYARWRKKLALK